MDTGKPRAEAGRSNVHVVSQLSLESEVLDDTSENDSTEAEHVAHLAEGETLVPSSQQDLDGTLSREFYVLKITKDNEESLSDRYGEIRWRKIDQKGKHSEKLATRAGNGYTMKPVLAPTNEYFSSLTGNSSFDAEKIKDGAKIPLATSASTMTTVSKDDSENRRPVNATKPRRKGHLPSYNFTFKCDERAQKRKEFYMKIEEKVRAREIERAIMEAKLKELEVEQIKILRKALTFKAKPMPSFYFGRPQGKVDLKKNLPTMPKPLKPGPRKTPARTIPEVAAIPTTNHRRPLKHMLFVNPPAST